MTSIALVYRGSFDWQSGLEVALVAMRRAVDAGVSVEAVLAGDGPERERVLFTIHDLGLADRVRVAAPDAGEAIDSDRAVFLWPALRAGDLAPLRDAVGRGMAVIASDLPEARRIVHPGQGDLLVAPRDADALAEAIARCAT